MNLCIGFPAVLRSGLLQGNCGYSAEGNSGNRLFLCGKHAACNGASIRWSASGSVAGLPVAGIPSEFRCPDRVIIWSVIRNFPACFIFRQSWIAEKVRCLPGCVFGNSGLEEFCLSTDAGAECVPLPRGYSVLMAYSMEQTVWNWKSSVLCGTSGCEPGAPDGKYWDFPTLTVSGLPHLIRTNPGVAFCRKRNYFSDFFISSA